MKPFSLSNLPQPTNSVYLTLDLTFVLPQHRKGDGGWSLDAQPVRIGLPPAYQAH